MNLADQPVGRRQSPRGPSVRTKAEAMDVPIKPEGPDFVALATLILEDRPRLYLTNSTLQNPTGPSLLPVTAQRILRLPEANEPLVVEDEIFGDLEPDTAPRLAGFERVMQIGSFSKTLTAAHWGWIAMRQDWVEPLVDLKLALILGNGHVCAALAHGLLTNSSYRSNTAETRRRLAEAMVLSPMISRPADCRFGPSRAAATSSECASPTGATLPT